VLHTVKEEDDPQKEQQVVITGDHVLGSKIDKRNKVYPGYFLDVPLVSLGNGMGQHIGAHSEQTEYQEYPDQTATAGGCVRTPMAVKQS
jgi:hypothetical protein